MKEKSSDPGGGDDRLPLRSLEEERLLLGPYDRTARLIRERLDVALVSRGGGLRLIGERDAVRTVRAVLEEVLRQFRRGHEVDRETIEGMIAGSGGEGEKQGGGVTPEGVRARTPGQRRYMEAIRSHAIAFAVGPAGTGKTYLAVAMAVEALRKGEFRKIVLARPAVEAGERLGFLPGGYQEKVNPYLRPLHDALGDLLEPDRLRRLLEQDVVEVVPLAYMRGRTLNHSFIILDEGQNTTPRQMQMFLTRMGERSKIVVTGDVTQTDLPDRAVSGLVDAWKRLERLEGIALVELTRADIVRHPLVQAIVEAYGRAK
ncbi:MAG TPA: PhoH family protein [Planctomycetota bacterium]|nr:PhoH family protein [Planctomycetota bacterium]